MIPFLGWWEACAHQIDTDQVTVILSVYKYETHMKHVGAEWHGRLGSRQEPSEFGWTFWVCQDVERKHFKTEGTSQGWIIFPHFRAMRNRKEAASFFKIIFFAYPHFQVNFTLRLCFLDIICPQPLGGVFVPLQEGPKASRSVYSLGSFGPGSEGLADDTARWSNRIVFLRGSQNRGACQSTNCQALALYVFICIICICVDSSPPFWMNSGTSLECGAGHVASRTNGRVLVALKSKITWFRATTVHSFFEKSVAGISGRFCRSKRAQPP